MTAETEIEFVEMDHRAITVIIDGQEHAIPYQRDQGLFHLIDDHEHYGAILDMVEHNYDRCAQMWAEP